MAVPLCDKLYPTNHFLPHAPLLFSAADLVGLKFTQYPQWRQILYREQPHLIFISHCLDTSDTFNTSNSSHQRQTSLITKLPLAGVLYLRFGSDSHVTVPSDALRINLNSNVDEIGNSSVSVQFGYVVAVNGTALAGSHTPISASVPTMYTFSDSDTRLNVTGTLGTGCETHVPVGAFSPLAPQLSGTRRLRLSNAVSALA
jgi:hypothetical protein